MNNNKEINMEDNYIYTFESNFNKFYLDNELNNQDLEHENIKIQNEAKELIEKTRRMMETIDAHKFNSDLNTINKPPFTSISNPSATARSKFSDYFEEKPFDYTKIAKIEKEDNKSKIKSFNLDCNTNLNLLNQRLLEKIKIIKNLEKEIKDKNNFIEKLNSKIDKQHDEIKKLNDKLNVFDIF